MCFPVNFVKFLRISFFTESLSWLFLIRELLLHKKTTRRTWFIFAKDWNLKRTIKIIFPKGKNMTKVNNKDTRKTSVDFFLLFYIADLKHTFTFCRGAEAATRGVLWKKVFLKIWQNSQENTFARVYFLIKLQALGLQLY